MQGVANLPGGGAMGAAGVPPGPGGAGWRNELGGQVHGPVVQAQAIHGDVYLGAGRPAPPPVPRQLPPPPAHFTGRAGELALLDRLAVADGPAPPVRLMVLTGGGGVGKTSLAAHWLWRCRDSYPAGHLYADLQGFGPDEPQRPSDVLGRFLRALGVAPEAVPATLAEQVPLYRSVTSGRPLIALLDNAASAAQVRSLLPGPGPSLVVVTTRRHLAGLALDGAHFTGVPPLDEQSAVELLARIAGTARTAGQPQAARAVVRLCGHLPLAVCVTAARLLPHPHWTLDRMAAELADERRRLSALSVDGDVSVRAVIDLSYRSLPPEAAGCYRLLALTPGVTFGAPLAAAATGTGEAAAERLLDTLAEASLLEQVGPRRWRYHDLVKLHAREQADSDPGTAQEAVSRIVGWYLRMAVAADLAVVPGRWHLGDSYRRACQEPPLFPGQAPALDWLESELPGLLAAVTLAHGHGQHSAAWQLCEALWGLFMQRRPSGPWMEAQSAGLAAALASGDRRAQARMHILLGASHLRLAHHAQAREHFAQALADDQAAGHPAGEATALEHLGVAILAAGDPGEALGCFTRARDIHERIGRARGAALMTRRIGEAYAASGRHREAVGCLRDARRRFTGLGDAFHEARTLTSLAQAHLRAGQPAEACRPLAEALATMTRLGAHVHEARIHVLLADAAAKLGEPVLEHDHLQQALEFYTAIAAPEATQIRSRLESLGTAPDAPEATPAAPKATPNDNPPPPG